MSSGIYASLNCGQGSKDDSECVAENRSCVAKHLGVGADRLISLYQVHSSEVAVAERAWSRQDAPQADAMVTRVPGLALGVLTADCAPVLLADPKAGVIGAVHAGWRGAVSGVLEAAIEAMENLGAKRAHIGAAIGPCISQAAYEVGEDFRGEVLERDGAAANFFANGEGDKPHFDLSGYAAERLSRGRIGKVHAIGTCTYAEEERLFSYRRTCHSGDQDYGRQISAIVIM